MGNNMAGQPLKGSPHPQDTILAGKFSITAAGAILAQDGVAASGVTVTKDTSGGAVGRYLFTFGRVYKSFRSASIDMIGPAAGAAFPTTTGSDPKFRLTADGGKSTLSVQFTRTDTQADAEAASGTVCTFIVVVSDML